MDRMYIRDLSVGCIIGTRPAERKKRQTLIINIEMECDLAPAGKSDRLEDAVNYSSVAKGIAGMTRRSRFFLIEKLAAEIARICLADGRVHAVTVIVDKPAAIKEARSAAISIRRARKD